MRNVTITYAPLMTNETWLSGICAVCVFFTSFHFHFSQRFRCGAPTGLCLAEYTNKYTKKKKKGNMYLKYTSLFKRVQAKPPHIDYVLLLFSGLQMVRRSYISWCGRKSAPTEGVRSVSGQRE